MPENIPSASIDDPPDMDIPMPIEEAVKVCFPYGGLKKVTLFDAIRKGELAYEKLGRAYFTTRRDVEKWRSSFRVQAKQSKLEREQELQEHREALLRTAQRLIKGQPVDNSSHALRARRGR